MCAKGPVWHEYFATSDLSLTTFVLCNPHGRLSFHMSLCLMTISKQKSLFRNFWEIPLLSLKFRQLNINIWRSAYLTLESFYLLSRMMCSWYWSHSMLRKWGSYHGYWLCTCHTLKSLLHIQASFCSIFTIVSLHSFFHCFISSHLRIGFCHSSHLSQLTWLAPPPENISCCCSCILNWTGITWPTLSKTIWCQL